MRFEDHIVHSSCASSLSGNDTDGQISNTDSAGNFKKFALLSKKSDMALNIAAPDLFNIDPFALRVSLETMKFIGRQDPALAFVQ